MMYGPLDEGWCQLYPLHEEQNLRYLMYCLFVRVQKCPRYALVTDHELALKSEYGLYSHAL